MHKFTAIAAIATGLLATSAYAGPQGFYMLGSVGASHASTNMGSDMLHNGHNKSASVDKSNAMFKIVGGYRMSHIALEGGYYYLGKIKGHATCSVADPWGGRDINNATSSQKAHAIAWDVLGYVPLGERFEVFGKAGMALTHSSLKYNNSVTWTETGETQRGTHFSRSRTTVAPKLGIGAEWNFTQNVALRAEYEHIFQTTKESHESDRSSHDLLSVGLKYTF